MIGLGVLLIVLLVALPAAWFVAEFKAGRPVRIALGVLALGVVVFLERTSRILLKRSIDWRATLSSHIDVNRFAFSPAHEPACAPNTNASVIALPDNRLAPLAPATASPAA